MAAHGPRLYKGSEIKGDSLDLRRVYTCIRREVKEGMEFQRRSEVVHVNQGKLKRRRSIQRVSKKVQGGCLMS